MIVVALVCDDCCGVGPTDDCCAIGLTVMIVVGLFSV